MLEELQEPSQDDKETDFRLRHEHLELWELFAASGPAWRYAPTGGIVGIDRAQFLATMEAFGTRPRRRGRLIKDLVLVEQGMNEEQVRQRAAKKRR